LHAHEDFAPRALSVRTSGEPALRRPSCSGQKQVMLVIDEFPSRARSAMKGKIQGELGHAMENRFRKKELKIDA
jgi:hypothetical protein